ncbi:uncharacterized protein CLUP02_03732 [Colletotrichum lupini]|uniref:Secreted protein n=1 Tax=Colletotrichum lupini TaxID=145971 RepID=A0A9Q8SJE6_9PEZI|nr:uncharacterized protein CLUP02_03732 [Colletotrichum lupini]UQC78255.1 hypothetical protein CLUP02_03732 [Colletotrichum lupini]
MGRRCFLPFLLASVSVQVVSFHAARSSQVDSKRRAGLNHPRAEAGTADTLSKTTSPRNMALVWNRSEECKYRYMSDTSMFHSRLQPRKGYLNVPPCPGNIPTQAAAPTYRYFVPIAEAEGRAEERRGTDRHTILSFHATIARQGCKCSVRLWIKTSRRLFSGHYLHSTPLIGARFFRFSTPTRLFLIIEHPSNRFLLVVVCHCIPWHEADRLSSTTQGPRIWLISILKRPEAAASRKRGQHISPRCLCVACPIPVDSVFHMVRRFFPCGNGDKLSQWLLLAPPQYSSRGGCQYATSSTSTIIPHLPGTQFYGICLTVLYSSPDVAPLRLYHSLRPITTTLVAGRFLLTGKLHLHSHCLDQHIAHQPDFHLADVARVYSFPPSPLNVYLMTTRLRGRVETPALLRFNHTHHTPRRRRDTHPRPLPVVYLHGHGKHPPSLCLQSFYICTLRPTAAHTTFILPFVLQALPLARSDFPVLSGSFAITLNWSTE